MRQLSGWLGGIKLIPLPQKKYQIIYADPPWEYKQSGSETNSRAATSISGGSSLYEKDVRK